MWVLWIHTLNIGWTVYLPVSCLYQGALCRKWWRKLWDRVSSLFKMPHITWGQPLARRVKACKLYFHINKLIKFCRSCHNYCLKFRYSAVLPKILKICFMYGMMDLVASSQFIYYANWFNWYRAWSQNWRSLLLHWVGVQFTWKIHISMDCQGIKVLYCRSVSVTI